VQQSRKGDVATFEEVCTSVCGVVVAVFSFAFSSHARGIVSFSIDCLIHLNVVIDSVVDHTPSVT
jgi:hypothetical protein